MNNQFGIKIIKQHWVNTGPKDNPHDLCSHGEVYVRIGDEVISNDGDGSWTLSAAALYLMRTLNEDYHLRKYDGQLIPCCGHFFMAGKDKQGQDYSIMTACGNGIDWEVQHLDNGKIKHIAKSREVGIIDKTEYRNLVMDFADQVEQFYKQSQPKIVPEDELERKGYEVFWSEWGRLRRES